MDRLQSNEDKLGSHVEELEREMSKTSQRISQLEFEVKEQEGRLEIAQKIRTALESQRQDWMEQLESLTRESQRLEEQETVTVAASVYLAELPQWQRKAGLQVCPDLSALISPAQKI